MRRPLAFRSLRVATLSDGRREPRAVSDGTTLLFGLPGVRVERVGRLADGTRVVHVATAEEAAGGGPAGGAGRTTAGGPRSPRPSRRSRRGRGPPDGYAPRSARRSGMRPVRWPRSPPATAYR